MFAIVAHEFGEPDVLELSEQSDPRPGPGQIRVRVHAVGVNPYDTYMRAGGYAITPDLPYTPGADAAGVIDELGDGVTGVRPGDRVYIGGTVKNRAYGAYASMVLCQPHQVHPLPERLSFAQGAAINVPYATAWRALFQRAKVAKGESVLVHGASGAVGLAVTQMAHAAGLTVVGTASSDEGAALVRAQGADHVLNHRESGYLEQVTSLTGGGPNVIIEMLANQNLDHDLSHPRQVRAHRHHRQSRPRGDRPAPHHGQGSGGDGDGVLEPDERRTGADSRRDGRWLRGRHARTGDLARAAAGRGRAGASARDGARGAGEDRADSLEASLRSVGRGGRASHGRRACGA